MKIETFTQTRGEGSRYQELSNIRDEEEIRKVSVANYEC